jgi:hypothetical protein
MNATEHASEVFLTAPQVRKRFGGRSDMWLWRMLREEPSFPRPLMIRGHRYWRISDLVDFEARVQATPHASAA